MLQYYDAVPLTRIGDTDSILLHAPLVSLVSQTAIRRRFPWNSRIKKIELELHFIRHRVVQGYVEGWGTRLDWVLRFKFTTEEVAWRHRSSAIWA